MKKLHKLIISSYLGPFVLTFFITLFILVMQFLWKYIDEMVGKGLEWYIIAKLLFYASANLVPLALPLTILLSSIMTFGNLGENYELIAMKSSGISLQRIMFPLIIIIALTSGGAFYFSNYVWPVANLKFATLLYDIRQKKPAIDIKNGVFYKGIENYVIRVGKKEKDGQTLHDVLIYDHTDRNTSITRAKEGRMQMSDDERYLIITLYNGFNYDEMPPKDKKKDQHALFRSNFKKDIIRLNLEGFNLEHSDEELFKDNYQMLNLKQLAAAVDTLNQLVEDKKQLFINQMNQKLVYFRHPTEVSYTIPDSAAQGDFLSMFNKSEQISILQTAMSLTRSAKLYINSVINQNEQRNKNIRKHLIEWHRKWTLSVACIILFFIGAPLGAIIRKGGLGMPVVASVLFFLVFHVLSIVGEKMVKQGVLSPPEGMWMASAILFPVGVFLTYKATTDSVLLNTDTYLLFFKKLDKFIIRFFVSAPKDK